jgi:hypothetical protein
MLIIHAYRDGWPLCLGLIGFFVVLSLAAWYLRVPRLECSLNPKGIFWGCMVFWLVFLSIVTTLIDSPYLPLSKGAISMLFMVAAFVGLPLSMPPLVAAVWALHAMARGERVRLSSLLLLMLGAFSLGAVTSNMHDVLWCGIITHGYSQPYAAGGDLVAFYFVANWFGIPKTIQADYAFFGACMILLVLGELLLAAVSLRRFFLIESHK